jgi:hypothetical protein
MLHVPQYSKEPRLSLLILQFTSFHRTWSPRIYYVFMLLKVQSLHMIIKMYKSTTRQWRYVVETVDKYLSFDPEWNHPVDSLSG